MKAQEEQGPDHCLGGRIVSGLRSRVDHRDPCSGTATDYSSQYRVGMAERRLRILHQTAKQTSAHTDRAAYDHCR